MSLEPSEVEPILRAALYEFVAREERLLKVDASERSITHKLAEYVKRGFPGWDVDCEYNRYYLDPKTMLLHEYTRGGKELPKRRMRRVYPDVIVHHQVTHDNLLVLEVKKSTNPRPEDEDWEKLREFGLQLGYQTGAFVRVYVGPDYGVRPDLVWYEKGVPQNR